MLNTDQHNHNVRKQNVPMTLEVGVSSVGTCLLLSCYPWNIWYSRVCLFPLAFLTHVYNKLVDSTEVECGWRGGLEARDRLNKYCA